MEKLNNILLAIEHLQGKHKQEHKPARKAEIRAQISSLLETRDQLKRNIHLQVY